MRFLGLGARTSIDGAFWRILRRGVGSGSGFGELLIVLHGRRYSVARFAEFPDVEFNAAPESRRVSAVRREHGRACAHGQRLETEVPASPLGGERYGQRCRF